MKIFKIQVSKRPEQGAELFQKRRNDLMLKRIAWLCAVMVLVPAISVAADSGAYYPPQSPKAVDAYKSPADGLNRNVRILRTSNKAQLNRYVPKVYTFRNVNPFDVLRFIRRPIQAEDGAVFTFVSPDGKGGRVLIAVPEYQLESIDRLMEAIDKPGLTGNDDTRRIYRQLKHRRININPTNSILDDSSFIATFGVYLTGNRDLLVADPTRNAIFIQDAASGAVTLDDKLSTTLDKPTPMAVLNTKMWEVTVRNSSRIGLDYIDWKNGPGANLFAIGGFAERGNNSLTNGSSALLDNTNGLLNAGTNGSFDARGSNFAYRYEFHSAFFDFLATKGKAKVLNSARIAVLSGRPATITSGDQLLFYTTSSSDPSGIRPSGQPFAANTPGNRDLDTNSIVGLSETSGLNAELLTDSILENADPTVNRGGRFIKAISNETEMLTLNSTQTGIDVALFPTIYENGLDVSISGSVGDFNGFDSNGSPLINSRNFSTTIRLGEGEDVVLGGLARTAVAKVNPKAPFLGSLPIIGSFFGSDNQDQSNSEIVIALGAESIIRFDDADRGISDDDQAVIDQADGSSSIDSPDTTWGFDMMALDPEKAAWFDGGDSN